MNLFIRKNDSVAVVRWFLDHGAPVNGLASDPRAPIRIAAGGGTNLGIVRLLLSRGAKLGGTDALHTTAFRSAPDDDGLAVSIMSLLLDEGADIDELGYEGWDLGCSNAWGADKGTALHVAAAYGHMTRAKVLIALGADVGKKSELGYTAKDWAQLMWREDIRDYLETIMRGRGIEVADCEVPELWRCPPTELGARRPYRYQA